MRAMVQTAFGGPEAVALHDVPVPTIAADEVLIHVAACAVNRLDLLQLNGPALLPGFVLPHVAGTDVAGTVAEVGADVTDVAVGARVVVDPTLGCGDCTYCGVGDFGYCGGVSVVGGNRPGGFAEYVAVKAVQVHSVPDEIALTTAAALPSSWSTAYHALFPVGRLAAGETILIQAAASAVSLAAAQLALEAGARVVAVAGSQAKLDAVRALGVQHCVPLDADPIAYVRELTDGRGAEIALDHVGPATWPISLGALGVRGRLVFMGQTSGDQVNLGLAGAYHRELALLGSGAYTPEDFSRALQAFWSGKLSAPIAAELPLESLPAAFDVLTDRATVGKVLVRP
ncbi:alcohol dehydrogenase catalytic domain-containing protein [Cryptosporangium aurantiacum]|uniref:NADPH:quinone reductase n=1 Tax=Cryptosporangium aurantiacum TaxID=134849 RepID=A0A1M7MLS8_9ACTN|nr:alcohol dehydrogenase catalytic domain-containing protein [Cryptosporangium aurantiacum]SHM91890.1 NADPH:quinone reductase [Cryptosporangium aurantiacum]